MPTPEEVEKITDSIGIVPQPNEGNDEPGDNADVSLMIYLKKARV